MNPFNVNSDNPFIPHWLKTLKNQEDIQSVLDSIDFDNVINLFSEKLTNTTYEDCYWMLDRASNMTLSVNNTTNENGMNAVRLEGANNDELECTYWLLISAIIFKSTNDHASICLYSDIVSRPSFSEIYVPDGVIRVSLFSEPLMCCGMKISTQSLANEVVIIGEIVAEDW